MIGTYGFTLRQKSVAFSLRTLTAMICKIDATQLAHVPHVGPLIVVTNHINFLEIPIIYSRLAPRRMTGFAKAETWANPMTRFLFDTFEAIPLRRGELDMTAFRRAMQALEQGKIVAVAPEGTRSGDGRLRRGQAGAVMLALQSGAPILPLVHYGAENYRRDWSRLQRAEFHVVVGQPFRLLAPGGKVSAAQREQMTEEIMYQLAALLPPPYRGLYSDLPPATETWLHFEPPHTSNLARAWDVGVKV